MERFEGGEFACGGCGADGGPGEVYGARSEENLTMFDCFKYV